MKVHGITITEEQIAAGLAAMRPSELGWFDQWAVVRGLRQAGADRFLDGEEAANRLLQRERRAGRIKHIGGGKWQRVEGA